MTTPYIIEWLPGENILSGKVLPDFHPRDSMIPVSRDLIVRLDEATMLVPYILDITEMKMGFGDMVNAMAVLTRGGLAAFKHPKLLEVCFVVQSD